MIYAYLVAFFLTVTVVIFSIVVVQFLDSYVLLRKELRAAKKELKVLVR